MMLPRNFLFWLLAILLLISTAGQAAAVFPMPCRGTSFCCCSPSTASPPADSAVPADMDHGAPPECCETASSQPCDIQGQARPASLAVMAPVFGERLDIPLPPANAPVLLYPTDISLKWAAPHVPCTDRGRPPRYIEIQTFLC